MSNKSDEITGTQTLHFFADNLVASPCHYIVINIYDAAVRKENSMSVYLMLFVGCAKYNDTFDIFNLFKNAHIPNHIV